MQKLFVFILGYFYILYTNCVWIFTRFMVLFYTFYLNFYISFYLTMGLHSLNAIFHQITHVLYFYLCQYYVTCIMFLNSLQFENELKKVGTFVHLTFMCSFVSCLTFLASLFIFLFFLLFYYFMFLYCEGYYPCHLNKYLRCFGKCLKKNQKIFSNKVKVIYSKSNITKIVSKVLGCFLFLFFKLCYSNLPTFLSIN